MMSFLTYDFGSDASGSNRDASMAAVIGRGAEHDVAPPVSPTQSLVSPSSSIGGGSVAMMEGISTSGNAATKDEIRAIINHSGVVSMVRHDEGGDDDDLTPPLGGVTVEDTFSTPPLTSPFLTPLGSPTSASTSSSSSSLASSPNHGSLHRRAFGTDAGEPPKLARKKSVRFEPEVKAHDGLCRRAAVLDRLIHQYFVLQREISELDVLALTSSMPSTIQELHEDLLELCVRIEEAAASGIQAEPVLSRGGGMNTKLTTAHVSYLKILDQVVVAAKQRAIRNGASFQFQSAEEL